MNKTLAEAVAYVDELVSLGVPASVSAFILPPHTALAAVRDRLPKDSGIRLGAQNAHWAEEGVGTGEISMRMVRDAGASIVEVGHSERRAEFGETDKDVARKVAAALDHDLTPIVCVGESRVVREAGGAGDYVVAQVEAALSLVAGADPTVVVFAYEPVWAIGQHSRAATPFEVAPVVEAIRDAVAGQMTGGAGPVLYGGSVDEGNAVELLEGSRADGLFVGRAAWSAVGFARLLAVCADSTASRAVSELSGTISPEPARS